MRSDKCLKRWYRAINKNFFDNELPNNVCVRWVNEEDKEEEEGCEHRYFAWTNKLQGQHSYCIVISKTKNPGKTAVLATLAHEMIHVSTGMRDDHGPAFEAKRQMIADKGIFKKNALLKGRTIF